LIRDSFYFLAITLLVIHWLIVGEATVNFNIQHIQSILIWASPFILTVVLQVTGIFVRMFKNNVTGKFVQVLIFMVISSIAIIFAVKYLNRENLEMHFGSIKVDVIPADAQIELTGKNGEKYAMADKNIFSDLPSGQEYKIKASKKGLRTVVLEIKVWSEIENVSIDLEGTDDVKMLFVKGGTFRMGQPEPKVTGVYTDNEQPVHSVTIRDYYIGKTEITQVQYKAVMGENPSAHKSDYYAVEGVKWYDAVEFCNKLSDMEGLDKCYSIDKNTKDPYNMNEYEKLKYTVTCNFDANGYRLPTEAEWEFAARGGRSSKGYEYSGSNNIDDVALYSMNLQQQTALKKPNELGLYDMSGSVQEWCWDWIGTYPNSAQTDPKGPIEGSERVLRGGHWGSFHENCRVTSRKGGSPEGYHFDSGLRVARSVKP
jgi:formylglycine-generating enzyme required for sulfatase activity